MSCNPELVSAFLDGELEPIIVRPVLTHLLRCDDCCQTMGWLAQIKETIAVGTLLWQDPEEMTRTIMGAIRNEKVYTGRSGLFGRLRRFGVPAVLIAGALAALPATPSVAEEFPPNESFHEPAENRSQCEGERACCMKKGL
ncbi:MAG: zf-HC2 domain-containing protein [Magnetococcales bacterium]|nr:zf-HC2 domain-containing protein [Magnetococcales bacterium]